MELQTRFDDAVSPVVGVILMVAVTVILAAVIGTFVLDLGNNVQANPQAGVDFEQTNGPMIDTTDDGTDNPDTQSYNVSAQIVSLENADKVDATAADNDNSQYDAAPGDNTSGLSAYDPVVSGNPTSSVGSTIEVSQLTAGDKITIVGSLDGKQVVLQSYTVDG